MTRKIVLSSFLICCLFISGCSFFQGLISDIMGKDDEEEVFVSPYAKPEGVFCNYMHYFRARNNDYSQWWFHGRDPNTRLGPEPWRRHIWIGRTGDYPYIGIYDNIEDTEIMRWHIRLAKASGITAFFLAIIDAQTQRAQTDRLLDVAHQENFKIGFMESHSYLGAVPRKIIDGLPQPILPRKYLGYEKIMEDYSRKTGLSLPYKQLQYDRPTPRALRAVPADALQKAGVRISAMLKQWISHPAYLRIDGKPLIVIPYGDSSITPGEIKSLISAIKANLPEDLYVVTLVPQIYWYFWPPQVPHSGIDQNWADTGTDCYTHWTPNGMITATQRTRLEATTFNVQNSLKWGKDPMIPIMPGFDDDSWQHDNDDFAAMAPRNNGQAWSDQLDAALVAKPRFLFIQAWNEWHEGSQIEPSTMYSDPYLYLKILAQKLGREWAIPPLPPQSSIDPWRLPYLPY